MTDRSGVEQFVAPFVAAKPQAFDHAQARLSMRWSLDPTTGKLTARWIADGSDMIGHFKLESAA